MYSREIAEIISQDIKYAGGLIEPDEIMRYTPKVRDPVVTSAFGYTYIGSPSPSSGGYTLGAVMKFLDGVSVSLASLGGESHTHIYIYIYKYINIYAFIVD
jgi:gamma-glutamyltranspeptidase